MNEERILELADYVEGLENYLDFDVNRRPSVTETRPFHMDNCPQCLIGQSGVLFSSLYKDPKRFVWNSYEASEVLGLDSDDSNKIFFPSMYADGEGAMKEVTPKIAAEVLRNFVDTGNIEWPRYESVDTILSDSYHEFDLSDD